MHPTNPEEKETDPAKILQMALRVLRRGRVIIPMCGLLMLVAVVGGLKYVPKRYKSEATISIDEQQISQRLVTPLSSDTAAFRVQALSQEILSRTKLMEIVREYDLYDYGKKGPSDPNYPEAMRKAIDIQPVGEGRDGSLTALRISFTAATPELARSVTQKLCLLFIETNSAGEVQRANTTTNFFKEPLEEKKKKASQLQQQIAAFKAQHATDLTDGRSMNDTRLTEARMQLQNVQSNLAHAKEQRVVYESMLNGDLGRLKTERATLLIKFTPKHPSIVKKDEEIATLEELLNNPDAGVKQRLSFSDPTVSQLAGQMAANQIEIENLTKDERKLEATSAELQSHLALVPVHDQQLAELQRQADAVNEEVTSLEKLEQQSGLSADMERNQKGRQFRLLDPASLSSQPSFPKKLPISAGAMGAGLACGLVIAFLLDLRVAAFHDEQELREEIGPPMVLSIPSAPTKAEKRSRRIRTGMEVFAGSVFSIAMLAVEFWVYKRS